MKSEKNRGDGIKEKMNVANVVTLSRMVFAVLVLFSDAFSVQFYIFYLIGAFTDMIDGTIARKLNLKSLFGSKLDSVADFVFTTAVFVNIGYVLYVPRWIWIAIITFIKIINLILSLIIFRRLVSMHTVMNKITGVLLFLLPFNICRGSLKETEMIVIIIGLIATFAAIQEGHYIRTGREIE